MEVVWLGCKKVWRQGGRLAGKKGRKEAMMQLEATRQGGREAGRKGSRIASATYTAGGSKLIGLNRSRSTFTSRFMCS